MKPYLYSLTSGAGISALRYEAQSRGGFPGPPSTEKSVKATARRRKVRGPAKILLPDEVDKVLDFLTEKTQVPEVGKVKFLLSLYAGLRACEIAGLRISDVTDASGRIGQMIRIRAEISKNGRAREIPMHSEIRKVIEAFRSALPDSDQLAVSHRYTTTKSQTVNSVTVWFHWMYKQVGLKKCSSHSGRRTFITGLSRAANQFGSSLRDVQILAGHARIDTTESYIEPAENLTDLVNSIGRKLPSRRRECPQ